MGVIMKAILEFNLPDDESDFQIAGHAMDWALTVWELDQLLRNYLKYGHNFESTQVALETVRNQLFDFLEQRHITLDTIP